MGTAGRRYLCSDFFVGQVDSNAFRKRYSDKLVRNSQKNFKILTVFYFPIRVMTNLNFDVRWASVVMYFEIFDPKILTWYFCLKTTIMI